ncbi:LysM peptidoglycan-binding domain-containing protein [Psychrobacillus sp.]|uniref:LysM peptidoglycan-binding domain-containing protein n=1 Tax=Psychrobacillus sp. TaxID=1871623 RepID=UPI0028BDC541|nr:LysM peptidoglycan-binding domain-containing protein [Psychrobacillus sp.]
MTSGFYLSANNDKEGFRLPVNPESIKETVAGDSQTYTIAKLGQVSIIKNIQLAEYTIDSFFPIRNAFYVVAPLFEPSYYIGKIKEWQVKKEPIRFIYTEGSFVINELVSIENFECSETAGDEDVYYTLSFKKYVSFEPKKMVVQKTSGASKGKQQVVKKSAPPRQNKKEMPKTYSMIQGDSLWKIAQKFLGNGSRYTEIQQLNGIKDSQLRKLPIGLKIKLPPK